MMQQRQPAHTDITVVFWLWMLVIGAGLATMIALPLAGR